MELTRRAFLVGTVAAAATTSLPVKAAETLAPKPRLRRLITLPVGDHPEGEYTLSFWYKKTASGGAWYTRGDGEMNGEWKLFSQTLVMDGTETAVTVDLDLVLSEGEGAILQHANLVANAYYDFRGASYESFPTNHALWTA